MVKQIRDLPPFEELICRDKVVEAILDILDRDAKENEISAPPTSDTQIFNGHRRFQPLNLEPIRAKTNHHWNGGHTWLTPGVLSKIG